MSDGSAPSVAERSRSVRSGFPLHTVRGWLLLLLLVALLPALAGQILAYGDRLESRRQRELQSNLELARAVASAFDRYVRDLLQQETAIGLALTSSQFASSDQANAFLAANAAQYRAIRNYSWVDPSGLLVSSSEPQAIGQDVRDRAYYQEIIQGRDWVVSELDDGRATGETSVFVARATRDGQGALLGVVLAVVDPSLLGAVLTLEGVEQGAVALLDRWGSPVYSHPEIEMAAGVGEGAEIVTGFDGERRMMATSRIASLGWVVQVSRPSRRRRCSCWRG